MSDTLIDTATSDTTTPAVSGATNIGMLYNVFGQNASSSSCKTTVGQVIDGLDTYKSETQTVGNVEVLCPEGCTLDTDQTTNQATTNYGSSYTEFVEDTVSTLGLSGSYGFFSGSLDIAISDSSQSASNIEYCTVSVEQRLGLLTIDNDTLSDNLNSDFESDLNDDNLTAQQFFDAWGTHIVVGIKIGGLASWNFYAQSDAYSSSSEFIAAAEAEYMSVSGYAGFDVSSSVDTSSLESSSSLQSVGGNSSLVLQDADWDDWVTSVEDNPDWYAFGENGLKPVWELCSDWNNGSPADGSNAKKLQDGFATLYTPVCNTKKANWFPDESAYQSRIQTQSENLVMTGFGAALDSDSHCNYMIGQFLDLQTGERNWYGASGSVYVTLGELENGDKTKVELYASVPEGMAMTGLELGCSPMHHCINYLRLYYQELLYDNGDRALGKKVGIVDADGNSGTVAVSVTPDIDSNSETDDLNGIWGVALGGDKSSGNISAFSVIRIPVYLPCND